MRDSDSTAGGIETALDPVALNTWRLVRDKACLTPQVIDFKLKGSGSSSDPYLVEWIPRDPRNPMNFSFTRKWVIAHITALSIFVISFSSSAYTGGIVQISAQFEISHTVALLGVSTFVLGFAMGPLIWAPLCEMYGRRIICLITYAGATIFDAACIGAQSATQIIVLRFIAGVFGSATLTNSGGVMADMFNDQDRGQAMSIFACAPFMGPVLGPVVGGYLGESISWRYIMVLITCLTGTMLIAQGIYVPETYAPVLLRHRARELEKLSKKVHVSRLDHMQGPQNLSDTLKVAMSRPWILLFKEPIVLILSIYMAIIYGTLYMLFAAFPIVFQQTRGWGQGQTGLAFFGTAVGMAFALAFMFWENKRFNRLAATFPRGRAPPEARLVPTMVAAVALPIGLFWFAWTNGPDVHWMVCIVGSSFFGIGNIMLNLGCVNYLVDSYVIYTASVMAANSMLRSVLGATFPLFTGLMYQKLGLHWASSIPAFLALLCMPFPFIFYRYGPRIRARCKYAVEAREALDKILESTGDIENITELDIIEEEKGVR